MQDDCLMSPKELKGLCGCRLQRLGFKHQGFGPVEVGFHEGGGNFPSLPTTSRRRTGTS